MSAARGEHQKLFDGLLTDGLTSLTAAAHELKSPLSLIRQLSLMLESGNLSDAEKERIMRQIILTSERGLRLTSDLTRSTRLADAMFKLEPINPQQLCEDIIHELEPLFRAHNRKIVLVPHRHALLLIANRDLLRRIIVNFGDNALHYSEGDTPVKIKINSIDQGKTIRLGVRDFGPALSKNILYDLPDKLSDAPSPIFARPQSSGLGLFIASQFADTMNGRIGVMRHRDGATFFVDLQASHQLNLL